MVKKRMLKRNHDFVEGKPNSHLRMYFVLLVRLLHALVAPPPID